MYEIIVNPVAGNGRAAETAKKISAYLSDKGIEYRMSVPENREQTTAVASRAAEDPAVTAIIGIGGDGTDFDIACGLSKSGKPLGIIPAGTGNDFVKSIGIPQNPIEAMDFILNHKPRPVDIGMINDRIFLNVCGTGFDVTVLDYAEKEKKKHSGLTPYLIGLIKAIAHYKPVNIELTVDEKTIDRQCLICSVANGRWIGGGIPICPEAKPDDGYFDVVVIDDRPKWMIPLYLPGLLLGKDLKFKITKHILAKHVNIASEGMRLNIDGEVIGMDRAEFSILPGDLMLYW